MKNPLAKYLTAVPLLLFLSLASHRIEAQVKVTKITGQELAPGKNGIVYTLPRTQIHVELTVKKTQQNPGPLAEFAEDYLGLENVIRKETVSYSAEDARIWTTCEPDPGQVYLIEKEEKSSGETWISFGDKSPVLNMEKFGKDNGPAGFSSWDETLFKDIDSKYLFRKYTDAPNREVIDTVIKKVSIDTLVIEQMTFNRSMEEFTDEEKAKEAVEKIKLLDQDKYNLLVGYQETTYSRDALEFMYSRLEEERLEYLRLFTGVTVTENLKFEFDIFPDETKEEQEYTLAGLSMVKGLTTPDGQNDIMISLKTDQGRITQAAPAPGFASGIAYRIPAWAQAVLYYQGKELVSKRLEVLQLGSVLRLPPDFKRIEFDPETGGLKSVILE